MLIFCQKGSLDNLKISPNSYSIHVYGIKLGLNSLNSYLMAPELEFKMEIISIHGLDRGGGGRGRILLPPPLNLYIGNKVHKKMYNMCIKCNGKGGGSINWMVGKEQLLYYILNYFPLPFLCVLKFWVQNEEGEP